MKDLNAYDKIALFRPLCKLRRRGELDTWLGLPKNTPLSLPDFVSSGPHSHTSFQTMLRRCPIHLGLKTFLLVAGGALVILTKRSQL